MNIFDMGSKASFLFEVQGTSLSMSVLSFKSQERISSPYLAEVSLASSSEITFENIMQKEALLTLIGLESDRTSTVSSENSNIPEKAARERIKKNTSIVPRSSPLPNCCHWNKIAGSSRTKRSRTL